MGQAGTLLALSTLCADRECSRKQLVDSGAMSKVVGLLDFPSPEVRSVWAF